MKKISTKVTSKEPKGPVKDLTKKMPKFKSEEPNLKAKGTSKRTTKGKK